MKSPKVAKPVWGEFQYTLKSKQVQIVSRVHKDAGSMDKSKK